MLSGIHYKDNKKNEVIIWIHIRILSLASWILKFMDKLPCEKCIYYDDYGCMLLWTNEPCRYEPIIFGDKQ